MRQIDLIEEFMQSHTPETYNAAGHCGYTGDVFTNYSTVLCVLDRNTGTAFLNVRHYSSTTSKIQGYLRRKAEEYGFRIKEYEGDPAVLWNGGYMGAPVLTKAEFKPR